MQASDVGDHRGDHRAGRRGDIQGLRAVAVVLVVAYHVGLFAPALRLDGGFTGVDVFFVISGFVITRVLLGGLDAGRGVALGTFYGRRVRRLLPALALTVVVVVPAAQVLGPVAGTQVTARTGAAASVSLANVYLIQSGDVGYFDVAAEVNALLHTWSLSVEEQFYLVFPAALAAAWAVAARSRSRHRAVAALVGIGIVVSFVSAFVLTGSADQGGTAERLAFFSPFTRAWEFGVGAVLALGAARLAPRRADVAALTAGAGLVAIAVGAVAIGPATPFPGPATLLPVLGAALVIVGGSAPANPVGGALAWRPLQALGDLSYAWYLWHWPAIVFCAALFPGAPWMALVGAVVSLLPAVASYRFVEQPVRAAPAVGGRRSTAVLAVGCVVVPLTVSLVVGARPTPLEPPDFASAFAPHLDVATGCDDSTGVGTPGGACRFPTPDATGAAVLVGDSNAGQLSEAFVAAAHERGLDAVVATRPACPFIQAEVRGGATRTEDCRRYVEASMAALLADPPAVVVLAAAVDGYLGDDGVTLAAIDRSDATGDARPAAAVADPEGKAVVWAEAQRAVVHALAERSTVVVVQPSPRFGDWDPRRCAVLRWRLDPASCGAVTDRDEGLAERRTAVDAQSAGTHAPAAPSPVRLVDPWDVVCPDDPCTTHRDGVWVFRDSGHLAVGGSALLVPLLRDAMAPAG